MVSKVKSAAGLPRTPRTAQGFEANAGYGRHQGYGRTAPAGPGHPVDHRRPSDAHPSTTADHRHRPSRPAHAPTVDPERTGDRHFPGSKDV